MFVNLTPHQLVIHTGGKKLTLPPSGDVARVGVSYTDHSVVDDVPVYKAVYGDVTGLPAPQKGVNYIVSGMVLSQVDRPDVFAPGDLIRDDQGKPIGCNGLKK